MDENRVTGTVRNVGGNVEEGFGRVTGNTRAQTEGLVNQAAGAAQDLYGQARDSVADAAGAAQDTAATLEKWLRRTIETQPYTTAIVCIGIGWLLGRMHRPL
ncbi:MAG: CsbD family protein [Xanthobacteraceae bacterium]